MMSIVTASCMAQTTIELDDPNSYPDAATPIFRTDVNNIRDSFVGVWQNISGSSELTIYIYKIDDIPVGIRGNSGEYFVDALFGYYVYKENGIVIINSLNQAQINNSSSNANHAPFYGITNDGETIEPLYFKDYGIQIQHTDGNYYTKRGVATFSITNPGNTLQANFELKNRSGAGTRIITNGQTIEPYDYTFSIPTSLVLNKISNTPPPL